MRLVRELLAADAEPTLAQADAATRAARYLAVVSGGLGVRGAALLVRDPSAGLLTCLATTFPAAVASMLTDPASRGSTLPRRAVEERRAFLARRSTDDPLVRAVHEGDASVDTVAVLPLVDRAPAGALVLAGDESTLAPDLLRHLTPAVRLLALLASPHRDGAPPDPDAERRVATLRAERDGHAQRVLLLEAQVAELEGSLAAAQAAAHRHAAATDEVTLAQVAAIAAENARAAEALVAGEPAEPSPLVVVDVAAEWEHAARDHRVVVTPPSVEGLEQVRSAHPARIVVNVAAPGALAHLAMLRGHGVTAPVVGVMAHAGSDRVVGLGAIEAVGQPFSTDALIAAVGRAAPRGARVFAAGRDADALLKMRQLLTKQGLSVSLARDTKQIDELLSMVRPQVLVVDLALPMRQGYELVLRMARTTPVPALVVILADADPAGIFAEQLRELVAGGAGMHAKQWLTAVSEQPAHAKAQTRPHAPAG